MMFLYPLMLQAYRDVPFQPWLRGAIDGIEPAAMARLLGWRDMLRPGVLTHVHLHARLEAQGARSQREARGEVPRG